MNEHISDLNKVLINEGPNYDKNTDGINVCLFKKDLDPATRPPQGDHVN